MSDVAALLAQLGARNEPPADPALAAVRLARASIDALILKLGQSIDARVTAQLAGGLTQLTAGSESFVLKLETPIPIGTPVTVKVTPSTSGQPAVSVAPQSAPVAAPPLAVSSSPVAMPAEQTRPVAVPSVQATQTAQAPPVPVASIPVAAGAPSISRPSSELAVPVSPSIQATTAIAASPMPAPVPAAVPPPMPATSPSLVAQAVSGNGAPAPTPVMQPAGVQSLATLPSPAQIAPVGSTPVAASPTSVVPARMSSAPSAAVAAPPTPVAPAASPAGHVAMPTPLAVSYAPLPATQRVPQPPPPAALVPLAAPPPASSQPPRTPVVQATSPAQPTPLVQTAPALPGAPPVARPAPMPLQQVLADPVQAAARQTTVAPLLAQAAAILAAPAATALPLPVLEAIARVMAARVDLNRAPPDGKALRQAILQAGTLDTAPRQPDDMRSTLLALRSTLASFLGSKVEAIAPVVHRPPPPMAGEPARVPQSTPAAPLPDLSAEETAKQLLGHTDGALARTRLLQLASSPAEARAPGQAAAPELRFEIPMLLGTETGILQLLVQRDGHHKPNPRERGWRMRFAMSFNATGEVGADIALLGRAANVSIWAAEPATADALEAMLPDLAPALASHGLDVAGLRVRRGPPPRRPQAPGRLLDSAR